MRRLLLLWHLLLRQLKPLRPLMLPLKKALWLWMLPLLLVPPLLMPLPPPAQQALMPLLMR